MSSTMTSMLSRSTWSYGVAPPVTFLAQVLRGGTPPQEGAVLLQGPVSVAAVGERVAEGLRARVTEEVVPREDVVDLQAFRARETLADVALQERVVVDDAAAFPVIEQGAAGDSTARLAGGRWRHPPRTSGGLRQQEETWYEKSIPLGSWAPAALARGAGAIIEFGGGSDEVCSMNVSMKVLAVAAGAWMVAAPALADKKLD